MPQYYIPKKEFKIISYEEIKPYVDLAPDLETKVVIALAWLTGARIQEIVNLRAEDFLIDKENDRVVITIRALKHGDVGYPTFSFSDPFISNLIIPYLEGKHGKLFSRGKRRYQQILQELNMKIHGLDTSKWITFHYLRHSRLTFLARELRAFPEELKSWTGHRSQAFEEYYSPRRVERFKGKIR
jgi:integrase